MTMRGRFFTSYEYQQLVYGALVDMRGKIKTLPASILKPKMLWSGKQIVSTIIINLVPEGKAAPTLNSKSKIKGMAIPVAEFSREGYRECVRNLDQRVQKVMS